MKSTLSFTVIIGLLAASIPVAAQETPKMSGPIERTTTREAPTARAADRDPPVGSLAGLPPSSVGELVIVTDVTGHRTKGRITAVSPDGLAVRAKGDVRTFTDLTLDTIEHTDPLDNGVWIGLGAGMLATIGMYSSCPAPYDPGGLCRAVALAFGGFLLTPISAAIGAIVDRAIGKHEILRESRRGARPLMIAPTVGARHVGVVASITF